MKKMLFLFLFLCSVSLVAQTENANSFSVYLAGDGGEDTISGKALLLLKEQLLAHPNSAVIFLGDNAYPDGISADDKEAQKHLGSQLQILQQYKGQIYFIPGNHDWDAQGRKGLEKINAQQAYVEQYVKTNTLAANKEQHPFLPLNGLPGPETVLLKEGLRLVTIDTQWFLQVYKKNKTGSKKHTIDLFYSRLDSILNAAKLNKEQVIVVAHHPMYTNGKHSLSRQPLRFLLNYTPFAVFGLLGPNRLFSQDIAQPRYKKMRRKMLAVFNNYDNVIYASGHEHNLQFFKEKGMRYIISGCVSKRSHLAKKKKFDPVFQDDQHTGFVELECVPGKKISTIIYRAGEERLILDF
ncbi:MAG: hypothetical protein JWP12_248 [Bacteroidetes bacterium]|nr:hypothetical protein [Bacteroidota bacterium]